MLSIVIHSISGVWAFEIPENIFICPQTPHTHVTLGTPVCFSNLEMTGGVGGDTLTEYMFMYCIEVEQVIWINAFDLGWGKNGIEKNIKWKEVSMSVLIFLLARFLQLKSLGVNGNASCVAQWAWNRKLWHTN